MGLSRFSFSTEPLSVPALQASLADSRCGGYAAFEGWVRNHNEGREVTGLEYEAFAELAVREGERIQVQTGLQRFSGNRESVRRQAVIFGWGDGGNEPQLVCWVLLPVF